MGPGPWLRRFPAANYLVGLGLLIGALAFLAWVFPDPFWTRFVDPYLWRPIARDEGYNVVNTLALLVVLFFLGGWIYELLRRFQIRIDLALVLAGLPIQPAGSMLRVLEDSDYFAPFADDVARAGPALPVTASCVPEVAGGFLQDCLGALFVTPPIYVWLVLLLGTLGRVAYEAGRVATSMGLRAGLRFYGLSLVGLFALGVAWDASDPTYVRFVPPIAWLGFSILVGAATVGLFVWHRRRYDWRAGLFGYSLVLFTYVLFPVLVWLAGGRGAWRPEGTTRPAILVAGVAAAALFAVLVAWKARRASKAQAKTTNRARAWTFLTYLVLFEGFALFFAMAGALGAAGSDAALSSGRSWGWLAGGLVVPVLCVGLMAAFTKTRGTHPTVSVLRDPLNLLVLASQYWDALMTSLALDVYGTSEKHVLPRTLIAWIDSLPLPAGLDDHPALLVMVPFKLVLGILLLFLLDVRLRDAFAHRPNVPLLIKGVVLIVGLSPAIRDAIRMSMGV